MAFDFKAATPDTSIPSGAFFMGADSQSATDPSLYGDSTVLAWIRGLAHTWSANSAVSAPASAYTGTWFTGGTATTNKPHFLIEPTGTTSTGWGTAGTGLGINAASGFTGNLLDLQLNGAVRFRITSAGVCTVSGAFTNTGNLNTDFVRASTLVQISALSYLTSSVDGMFTVNNSATTIAASFGVDAANTLAQRNGTNAQTNRLYGTFTDASNYRRVALAMTTAGVATLKAEGAGTGASGNVLHISSLPTSNPGPGILWNNAGTPAIGT